MAQHAASSIFGPDAFERTVPRYTSYPPVPRFSDAVGVQTQARWLAALAPGEPVSLYIHLPFCERLCWYCACRTQAVTSYHAVSRYLSALAREIGAVAELVGPLRPVARIIVGGGSPSILAPDDIRALRRALSSAWPGSDGADLSVEIDPRDLTPARLAAFLDAGLTGASLAVLDTDERVQRAIGRRQGAGELDAAVTGLRTAGVAPLTLELLYGLPEQTRESAARSADAVAGLAPDRVAVYGYAHVPWLSRRQSMIESESLPAPDERRAQADAMRAVLLGAGYRAVGIDHFALPGDPLAEAAATTRLSRGFSGYQPEPGRPVIGLGASAVSALPQGYAQNAPGTAAYLSAIEGGSLAVRRGHALSLDDRVRREAIGQILCHLSLDVASLATRYGDFAAPVAERAATLLASAPADMLQAWRGGFRIAREAVCYARLIAAEFDGCESGGRVRHSLVV